MNAAHIDQFAGNFGSPMQLLILLVIILLLFGGNRLRSLGSDIGGAIKGFKKSMSEGDAQSKDKESEAQNTIEGKVINTETSNTQASQQQKDNIQK